MEKYRGLIIKMVGLSDRKYLEAEFTRVDIEDKKEELIIRILYKEGEKLILKQEDTINKRYILYYMNEIFTRYHNWEYRKIS